MTETDALTRRDEMLPMTAMDVRAQVNLIQSVMKAVMVEDTHFGTIPGTTKPTLYKAGSEKILSTFRIAVEPEVEDLSTPDEARYRVAVHGVHMGTGTVVGTGIGECSSNEEKYKWRASVCDEEWDETPVDRRRVKYKKYNNKVSKIKQVRTEPADIANTVLKMSKKRGQIDMTLTSTAASDVFTQDIEDMPDGVRESVVGGESRPPVSMPKPAKAKPASKPAAPPAADQAPGTDELTVTGVPETVSEKPTKNGGTRYGIVIRDEWYNTFDDKVGDAAKDAKEQGTEIGFVFIDEEYSGKMFHNITDVVPF